MVSAHHSTAQAADCSAQQQMAPVDMQLRACCAQGLCACLRTRSCSAAVASPAAQQALHVRLIHNTVQDHGHAAAVCCVWRGVAIDLAALCCAHNAVLCRLSTWAVCALWQPRRMRGLHQRVLVSAACPFAHPHRLHNICEG